MLFNVRFSKSDARLDVRFGQTSQQFTPGFESLQIMTKYKDAEPYTGSYEVTPKVDAQTLPTAQKMMAKDLTVKAIPIFDVSNNSGGRTVYIAKEV